MQSSRTTMATVSLKLLIDTEKNRVVFAEAEKDFVDILFSFLTLPIGTIIRLLGKQSSVGCMDKLYESVENLDAKYLETEACKTMLLQPRSTAERICEDLQVNADDLEPRRLYRCPNFDCFTKTNRLYSAICGARCICSRSMDKNFQWTRADSEAKDGVFLKGAVTYIVSDDLQVAPASIAATFLLLQKLGIKDAGTLERRTVDVQRNEVLSLLRSLLVSRMPLTHVFLGNTEFHGSVAEKDHKEEKDEVVENKDAGHQATKINLKFLENIITKEIVYAEAGNDLVDVLFSFLTFPLGSLVNLLNNHSSVGCVDHLYNSVQALAATGDDCFESEERKNMLSAPRLFCHFNCSNQLLRIEEDMPHTCSVQGCETCYNDGLPNPQTKCKHGIASVKLTEVNPKMPNSSTQGGGYAKKSVKFMITNEMSITPLSPSNAIDLIKKFNAPIGSFVQREVAIGEPEVMNLLRSSLTSSIPLCNVFSPKKKIKLEAIL